MKFIRRADGAVLLVLIASTLFAEGLLMKGKMEHAADQLLWVRTPTGNHQAVIAGHPSKAGTYAYRTRYPANFRSAVAHFHNDDRVVTVISGTIHVGFGDVFDEDEMKALPAGSVWTEAANQPHFIWAKDGDVVVQNIVGNGPSVLTPVQRKP